MSGPFFRLTATTACVMVLGACAGDSPLDPTPLGAGALVARQVAPAPSGVVTTPAGGGTLSLFPYTLVNFSTGPADRFDPINLVFTGAADPRQIVDASPQYALQAAELFE